MKNNRKRGWSRSKILNLNIPFVSAIMFGQIVNLKNTSDNRNS